MRALPFYRMLHIVLGKGKEGVLMERIILFFASMLAGFALIKVPLTGTFAALDPIATIVGIITILVFALALIYHGVRTLINR
jgi:hypothetical protein